MKPRLCGHEDAVIRAMRAGHWSAGLRDHVSACQDCSEVEQIAGWMGGLAKRLGDAETLPDPGLAWLRAEWAERQRLRARALRPVFVARAFAEVALSVVLLLSLFWIWPVASGWIDRLEPWTRALWAPSIEGPIADFTSPGAALLAVIFGYLLLRSWSVRSFG